MLQTFSRSFEERVGLHKNENVKPRKEKFGHIPFNLREAVGLELKRMLDDDLIEPVLGPTPRNRKCSSWSRRPHKHKRRYHRLRRRPKRTRMHVYLSHTND